MYYTYLLRLADNEIYIGYSSNLKLRLMEHRTGKVNATKGRLPVQLVFYSAFSSQKLATDFEKYLKTGSGFAFRNKHFI